MGRLLRFNLVTGLVLGVVGFYVGWWLGHRIHPASLEYFSDTGQNDVALLLGYLGFVLGFLGGLGFARYPLSQVAGRDPAFRENETVGPARYFGLCTDHKVVGIQYLIGIGFFFFVGGVHAMLVRVELLSPTTELFGPANYLVLVGIHGSMMMGMMTSGILGPFGNYLVPLMIGAKRVAFPRIEALAFWLLMAAGMILISTVFFGGFPTGWTGYAPLNEESNFGFDSYIFFFGLVGTSMTLLGLNLIVTIFAMRAPGVTWGRLPIFCWGVLVTSVLLVLAAPVLVATLLMAALDRTLQTSFFLASAGGSPYLYENLFWFFGHPEVYILALPGFGIVLELLPVFARKPLWGYRFAVAGIAGVGLISFFVWQHHLFVSGINGGLRPFYMFSTESISLPTGLIFLCGMATLWRAKLRFPVPMLFVLAWFFNFFVGGVSGVFLSDVPSNVSTHGSYFVMAHFHYVIMGGLVFAFMAAIYFWVPRMFGVELDERLGKLHFWLMFVSFNAAFFPLFIVGALGMPRRVVTYSSDLIGLNVWVSIWAFVLGMSLLILLVNVVRSLVFVRRPATENPWESQGLEWKVAGPLPPHNFDEVPVIGTDPYGYDQPPTPSIPAGTAR